MTEPLAPPSTAPSTSRHEIEQLVHERVRRITGSLGFTPDAHLDWPPRTRVSTAVAVAVRDALDSSLALLAQHHGVRSAFVSVAWRAESVEVCVVDDGRAPRGRGRRSVCIDDARGLEHDVDDYGVNGTCQWWSVPLDLL